ncbi:superoxide dismutase [Shouchella clausii]|jgi:superoxide dismutase, Fe-Mn family|uniref:superoxide dismutase n=1 Tax=Shouchella clausii TaxID=79880 RepID=UPI000B962F6F|nr:superoxide dismutase [Shouchella clausii]PAD43188.1 superoxide dismutase [Bacillus sp. 7520-S]AST96622.1 superoxide dismutase [Shouchella clausii]MBU8596618.1 superoxide dismutase [Shouchella clausii]MCY1105492.1 superoxide dismutase [Shouchella clausii]MEB5471222.1 superoxide dismutase [Shouchella clausii]
MATHSLPELGFAFDALEPTIDRKTMEIHHGKHHQTYVNNLNAALENEPSLQSQSLEQLLANIESLPASIQTPVRNNGGGHLNHSLFWQVIAPPTGANEMSPALKEAIDKAFGNFEGFKETFTKAATTRFGSGWAWLVVNESKELEVYSTANQDNPIMDGKQAILGLDVWEHAYYLNYQNRRPEYIANFFSIINWEAVSKAYEKAIG